MKISQNLKEFLKDTEKIKNLKEDLSYAVDFLINKLRLPEGLVCRKLEKALEKKYGIPFEIEWYYKNNNYLIVDKLEDINNLNKFIVHIHIENDEEPEAEIETMDEWVISPYLETLKPKDVKGFKVLVDKRGIDKDIIFRAFKDIDFVLSEGEDGVHLYLNKYKKELLNKVDFLNLESLKGKKFLYVFKYDIDFGYCDIEEIEQKLGNIIDKIVIKKQKKMKL